MSDEVKALKEQIERWQDEFGKMVEIRDRFVKELEEKNRDIDFLFKQRDKFHERIRQLKAERATAIQEAVDRTWTEANHQKDEAVANAIAKTAADEFARWQEACDNYSASRSDGRTHIIYRRVQRERFEEALWWAQLVEDSIMAEIEPDESHDRSVERIRALGGTDGIE